MEERQHQLPEDKIKKYIFGILLLIIINGCHKNSDQSALVDQGLFGLYEFVYEFNTEDQIENHYIVLNKKNGKMVGQYFGTTDDFDNDREGYLPGYFVADIKDLKINNNSLIWGIPKEYLTK